MRYESGPGQCLPRPTKRRPVSSDAGLAGGGRRVGAGSDIGLPSEDMAVAAMQEDAVVLLPVAEREDPNLGVSAGRSRAAQAGELARSE
jgi:hypothetical protein